VSVEPGTVAIEGRSAYYRSEADRVEALATATPTGEGREWFQEVAREYRTLAAWYAASAVDFDEPDTPLQPPKLRPAN
jgi:hypothetical protein